MKRTLLAVSGLNPQLITETLYALYLQDRLPNAIYIITTAEGKAAINANLLNRDDGHYYRFLRDYGINPDLIDFSYRRIYTVADKYGTEYDDIASEEENEQFLKLCMELSFELTKDPEDELYFSIAGGRKTMGGCLVAAAQCYARKQDRIFHVLVTPEFESCKDFYYPPPQSIPITLKNYKTGTPYIKETRYASVTLVPLPFFSIRERLSTSRLKEPETPAALMMSLVREKRGELIIDLKMRKLIWKGREIDMMPARLAIYAMFAFLKKDASCQLESCAGCNHCSLSMPQILAKDCNIAEIYKKYLAPYRDHSVMSDSGVQQLTSENFNSYRTRINKDIENGFGAIEAKILQISSTGRRPGVRYAIALQKDRIRIVI